MSQEYDGCDGVVWNVVEENNFMNVDATVYRYVDRKIQPDELGFKYYILTFKNEDPESTEVISAYIGDVAYFVNNRAKLGYNGVMVKNKSVPKKTIREMFNTVLTNWAFPDKIIRSVIRQV